MWRFPPLSRRILTLAALLSFAVRAFAQQAVPGGGPTDRLARTSDYSAWSATPPCRPQGVTAVDGMWSELQGTYAYGPNRSTHDGIYDPLRHRFVIFGGGYSTYLNDTWALDANSASWVQLNTQNPPPARRLQACIYDPVRDRLLVIGGYNGGFFGDVWALPLAGPLVWTQLTPSGPALPARAGHAAVYDPVNDRVVVFGGYDGVSAPASRRNDVWALSLSGVPTWSNITPAGAAPSARSSVTGVYDSIRQRMVIFGGTDPSFRHDAGAL